MRITPFTMGMSGSTSTSTSGFSFQTGSFSSSSQSSAVSTAFPGLWGLIKRNQEQRARFIQNGWLA